MARKKHEKPQGTEFLKIKDSPPKDSPDEKDEDQASETSSENSDEKKKPKVEPAAPPAGATKFCSKGNHWMPVTEFAKRAASPDGLQSACKDCMKAYQQQYAAERAAKAGTPLRKVPSAQIPGIPNAHTPTQLILVDNTGMTDEEFEAQSALQEGKCACCRKRKHRTLDINPLTGQRRALLCIQCNIAVAMVGSSKKVALRLFRYLKSWDESEALDQAG